MSKLLINEPPLQVLPTLAKAIGLNEAIVLQQLHYHSLRSKDDGWVQRSIEAWAADDFKFWGLSTVKRALARLRDLAAIEVETVPTSGGHEARIRVNHAVLENLELVALGSGQSDTTPSGQLDTTGRVRLTRGTIKGEQRETTENPPNPPGGNSDVDTVFAAWLEATGKTARTVLDPKRRRLIVTALRTYPLDEVVDAVRGWRQSRHHRGQNAEQRVYNDLGLLLRSAENIERFRDMERTGRAATSAGVGTAIVEVCPNGTTDAAAIAAWAPAAEKLRSRMGDDHFDVWLGEVHAHRLDGADLVLGCPLETHAWIKDRLGQGIANAAGRGVKFVACSGAKH